jgi:hypothetical protein
VTHLRRAWTDGEQSIEREKRVLKKMIIVSAAAAVALVGTAGIASAHEGGHADAKCTSNDVNHQSNKGHQLLGGNASVQDLEGNVLGAQATRPAGICPSLLNNNHL